MNAKCSATRRTKKVLFKLVVVVAVEVVLVVVEVVVVAPVGLGMAGD